MDSLRLFLSLPPGITWNLLAAFSEAGRKQEGGASA